MKFKDIVYSAISHSPKLEIDLSDEFEVAQSTVRKWANGISKPHPNLQKLITASIYRRQVRDARLALKLTLKDEPWFRGIGIGEVAGVPVLRLTVDPDYNAAKVPTLFSGFPVLVVGDEGP